MTNNEIIDLLQKALTNVSKHYNTKPEDTGIQGYESGVYSININGKPKIWFFNEHELGEWIYKVANES